MIPSQFNRRINWFFSNITNRKELLHAHNIQSNQMKVKLILISTTDRWLWINRWASAWLIDDHLFIDLPLQNIFFSILTCRNSSNTSFSNRLLFCDFEWWIDCEEHLAAKNQFVFQQLHRSTLAYIFLFHSQKFIYAQVYGIEIRNEKDQYLSYVFALPFVELMQSLCKTVDILICESILQKISNSIYYYPHCYSRMNT